MADPTRPGEPADPGEETPPDLRTRLWQLLPGLAGALIVVGAVGYWFREPVELAAGRLVDAYGALGVLGTALVLDLVPGVGPPPIVFIAYTGGMPWWEVVLFVGTGGVGSSAVGWALGRRAGRAAWLQRWLRRSGILPLLRAHSWRGVFLAGLLPLPYVLTTLSAGASGVSLAATLIGATARYAKALLNVALIAAGWGLAS
jgi:uncharacterized membrane protein YdjX (TVP38/TMEM64 family)